MGPRMAAGSQMFGCPRSVQLLSEVGTGGKRFRLDLSFNSIILRMNILRGINILFRYNLLHSRGLSSGVELSNRVAVVR